MSNCWNDSPKHSSSMLSLLMQIHEQIEFTLDTKTTIDHNRVWRVKRFSQWMRSFVASFHRQRQLWSQTERNTLELWRLRDVKHHIFLWFFFVVAKLISIECEATTQSKSIERLLISSENFYFLIFWSRFASPWMRSFHAKMFASFLSNRISIRELIGNVFFLVSLQAYRGQLISLPLRPIDSSSVDAEIKRILIESRLNIAIRKINRFSDVFFSFFERK